MIPALGTADDAATTRCPNGGVVLRTALITGNLVMHSVFYLIGVIVVVLAILSLLGLA